MPIFIVFSFCLSPMTEVIFPGEVLSEPDKLSYKTGLAGLFYVISLIVHKQARFGAILWRPYLTFDWQCPTQPSYAKSAGPGIATPLDYARTVFTTRIRLTVNGCAFDGCRQFKQNHGPINVCLFSPISTPAGTVMGIKRRGG